MWRTSWFIILIFLLQGICMSSGNISFLRLSKWFPFPYSSKNHPVGNAQTPQLKNPIYRPLCGIWSALNPKKVHTKAFSILRSPLRSPQQQLSTTPLFYIASTKGSSYLQDDVQVIEQSPSISGENDTALCLVEWPIRSKSNCLFHVFWRCERFPWWIISIISYGHEWIETLDNNFRDGKFTHVHIMWHISVYILYRCWAKCKSESKAKSTVDNP